jgi:hypothetical protein
VQYSNSKVRFGLWWRLTSVGGPDKFVCESISCPGYYLTKTQFGLDMKGPLTKQDRAKIGVGNWEQDSTLTIITLPDFAVWVPRVWVF